MKLNTNRHLHLMSRLMSIAMLPSHPRALIAWKGKTLPFHPQESVVGVTPRPLYHHYPLNKKLGGPPQCLLQDHPYYRVCPDILSLVCDPLSGNGCGSSNHT